MARTYLSTDDAIVALATPPGTGALAVIRCSGPEAIERCAQCFSRPSALRSASGYQLVHGFVLDPETKDRIDEVMAAVYRAPHSFTGEDAVELSCHGSPAIAMRILEALGQAGFVPALRGEFTFRAFLHGKADLVQAEAIDELVRSPADSAREAALARLNGELSVRFSSIRNEMLDILAECEAMLDYPEDEGVEQNSAWLERLEALKGELAALADTYRAGRLREEGALVVVAGRPNAGKSSLFNSLVREERAIVSPEPGTTRDWLESWLELEGYAVRLVDTAGLRQGKSELEEEGVRRARELVMRADAVVYLVDGVEGPNEEDNAFLGHEPAAIKVWNKIDKPDCGAIPQGWFGVSAKKAVNLGVLRNEIVARLNAQSGLDHDHGQAGKIHESKVPRTRPTGTESEVLIASKRQKDLVDACLRAVAEAIAGLDAGFPLDAISVSLHEAADALGQITGEIGGEEVFERIFGSFCLGK